MVLEPFEQFGPFRIVGRLGRGAMGMVYHAVDAQQRDVALKVMLTDVMADEDARQRFVREGEAVGRLQHRNIVAVFECGIFDGCLFMAMELLKGASLARRIENREPMSVQRKLDIVVQLCEGLQFAHDHGIVHRDVKPANIWVLENGGVKLLDFGVAHVSGSSLTRMGDVVGSAAYMSPEQIAGEQVDGRADIFAAGAVLFELLAGRRPFEAESLTGIMHKILHEAPPSLRSFVPDISPDIEAAVGTALQKDANARYAEAADFGTDMRLARYSVEPRSAPTLFMPRPAPVPASPAPPPVRPPAEARASQFPSLPDVTTASSTSRSRTGVAEPLPDVTTASSTSRPRTVAAEPPRRMPLSPRLKRVLPWGGLVAAVLMLAISIWIFVRQDPTTAFQLDVRSTPPGASVSVNGVPTGQRTPTLLSLAVKPERVGLTMAGFAPIEMTVPPGSDSKPVSLQYTLRRLLRVQSEPAGARILLEGRDTGLVTPADLELPDPPPTFVELELGDRIRSRASITPAMIARGEVQIALGSGRTAPVPAASNPAPPAAPVAEAAPTSTPTASAPIPIAPIPGAPIAGAPIAGAPIAGAATAGAASLGAPGTGAAVSVRITGAYPFEVIGCGTRSPAAEGHNLEVRAPCTLRLRAPMYLLDTSRTINASGGRLEIAAPQLARVQLRSRFEWCTVILNGRAVGAPPVDLELVAGTYTATIQCPERTYATGPITIDPGRSIRRLDEFLR